MSPATSYAPAHEVNGTQEEYSSTCSDLRQLYIRTYYQVRHAIARS